MADLSKDPPAAFDRVVHPTLRRQFSGVDAARDDGPAAAQSQEPLSGDRMCRVAAVKANHDPAAAPSPRFEHYIELLDREGEGLFDEDVFAGFEGLDQEGRVEVVASEDQD